MNLDKLNAAQQAKAASRVAKIMRMRAEGATLQQIGDKFGFTRERAHQIIKRANARSART